MDGNRDLADEIARDIISAGGRISFERFMELALYHPQLGYYTGARSRIGKGGDYFTSVSVGPLFGRILARQFLRFRDELGNPPGFEVVEFGGHRGQLREDVGAVAPALPYRIVEAGDPRPDQITGVVFSNEFLDALPVHRVRVVNGEWQEIFVTVARASRPSVVRDQDANGRDARATSVFTEALGPLSTPRLAVLLRDLPVHLMEGYTTEVNLRALDWLDDVARRLRRGFILTIDYGYERPDYFAPHRRDGTLLCYHRHQLGADPFAHLGEQDITAHVEFTSLIERGRQAGLEPVLFTDQAHYLLQIGETEITEIVQRTAGQLSRERAAVHQLIHPEKMGRAFKVLIQKKG